MLVELAWSQGRATALPLSFLHGSYGPSGGNRWPVSGDTQRPLLACSGSLLVLLNEGVSILV